MVNSNRSREILVIGNGFDINCGLKSKFKDFFIERIKNNIEDFKLLNEILFFDRRIIVKAKDRGRISINEGVMRIPVSDLNLIDLTGSLSNSFTFWDVYFFFEMLKKGKYDKGLIDRVISDDLTLEDLNWCDIEQSIERFTNLDSDFSYKDAFLTQFILRFEDRQNTIKSIFHLISKKIMVEKYENTNCQLKVNECPPISLFLKELNIFEKYFQEYLVDITNKNHSYENNALNLFNKILGEKSSDAYILNFNYTIPKIKRSRDVPDTGTNVHGDLADGSSIIFGIDSTSTIDGSPSYIFSKTRRKLTNNQKSLSHPLPRPESISSIKFYGHSLSKADYSYFKSLFDFYNLYSSSIQLNFYFTNYTKSNDGAIFEDLADRVSKLMNDYGASLTNKEDGRNLLHKLLLEHRLKIIEIEDDRCV